MSGPQPFDVTGDVAMKDKDGYVGMFGRSDDVLNGAVHRIGTLEVESALVSHPAVAEAAAIGVPDAWNESEGARRGRPRPVNDGRLETRVPAQGWG